jgi:hypothetical protein
MGDIVTTLFIVNIGHIIAKLNKNGSYCNYRSYS